MWFWWFMLICDMLMPSLMIVAGRFMWKHYPRKINGIIGYRTTMSRKNMDTWKFAHEYCGKLWWRIGFIIFVPSVLIHLPFINSSDNTIGMMGMILLTVQIVVLIATVFSTERALKRTFTQDGAYR